MEAPLRIWRVERHVMDDGETIHYGLFTVLPENPDLDPDTGDVLFARLVEVDTNLNIEDRFYPAHEGRWLTSGEWAESVERGRRTLEAVRQRIRAILEDRKVVP